MKNVIRRQYLDYRQYPANMVGKWEKERERGGEMRRATASISWSRWVDRSIFRVNGISRVDYATGSRSTSVDHEQREARIVRRMITIYGIAADPPTQSSTVELPTSKGAITTEYRILIDINLFVTSTISRSLRIKWRTIRLRLCNSSAQDAAYCTFLSSFASHRY